MFCYILIEKNITIMKTKNIRDLVSILNDKMDADRLGELNIRMNNHIGDDYVPDYRLNIYGESEAIAECVLNIYGMFYEEPDLLTKYLVRTNPTNKGNILLQITDLKGQYEHSRTI